MGIEAVVLADSTNPDGGRITTWRLTLPKQLLAELNTHHDLSGSSGSSRAIPLRRSIDKVKYRPFVPELWFERQSGMDSTKVADPAKSAQARELWLSECSHAIATVEALDAMGIQKSKPNRLIEAWMYIDVVLTGTYDRLANFFAQRISSHAEPEMEEAAARMLFALKRSRPVELPWGGWHRPFGDRMADYWPEEVKNRVAVARCARVSYETHDGKLSLDDDLRLYNDLERQFHMRPFEHVAYACAGGGGEDPDAEVCEHANFDGWHQLRQNIVDGSRRTWADVPSLSSTRYQYLWEGTEKLSS